MASRPSEGMLAQLASGNVSDALEGVVATTLPSSLISKPTPISGKVVLTKNNDYWCKFGITATGYVLSRANGYTCSQSEGEVQ